MKARLVAIIQLHEAKIRKVLEFFKSQRDKWKDMQDSQTGMFAQVQYSIEVCALEKIIDEILMGEMGSADRYIREFGEYSEENKKIVEELLLGALWDRPI